MIFQQAIPNQNDVLGPNKNIRRRIGGNTDTISSSTESGGLRMRLKLRTGVPAKVAAFRLAVGYSYPMKLPKKIKFI
jgi:hypothetical protein